MNKRAARTIFEVLCATTACLVACSTCSAREPMKQTYALRTPNSPENTWSYLKAKTNIAGPLSLAELADMALNNNPSTRQAWQNVRASQFIKKQTVSARYPQATVSAAVNREKTKGALSSLDVNEWSYGPSFNITYLLLDFGGRGSSIEEASQNIVAATYQLDQTIQDVLLTVEQGYYGLHSAYANLRAAAASLLNARKVFYSAQQRFDVGLASKLDVLQAKANYDNMRSSLEDARANVKIAKGTLAQAVGFPANTEFEIVRPSYPLPTTITNNDVEKLIEEAMVRRPDIVSAKALVKAKEEAVKVANSALWPTVNLNASAEANRYKYIDSNSSQKLNHDHTYSGSASVDWDVFDGFNNINKKRQAEAEAAAEYEKLIVAELQVSADVWSSYYTFSSAVSKLRFSRSFLNSAGASYELILEGYNTGLKSMLDLLDAQSKLSEARSQLIQSEKGVFIALAELAHSTGSLYAKEKEMNADE